MPIRYNDKDRANEARVATILEGAWRCKVTSFGHMAPVDWYFSRAGALIGVAELKCRSTPMGQYKTVFLSIRKWLALLNCAVCIGVPALFIVDFNDSIGYINVLDVDASKVSIGGMKERTYSVTNIEPMIEVDVADLKLITTKGQKQ